MRKLIYSMGVSLDGFIAGRNGEIDWVFGVGDQIKISLDVELAEKVEVPAAPEVANAN